MALRTSHRVFLLTAAWLLAVMCSWLYLNHQHSQTTRHELTTGQAEDAATEDAATETLIQSNARISKPSSISSTELTTLTSATGDEQTDQVSHRVTSTVRILATKSGISSVEGTLASTTPASTKLVGVWNKLNTSALSQVPLDPQCSDPVCSNFASSLKCAKTVTAKLKTGQSITPTCRFQNGTSKPKYFLRSYPGSGNTWVRQVLEKVTGICTGNAELHILHSGMRVAVYNTRFYLL